MTPRCPVITHPMMCQGGRRSRQKRSACTRGRLSTSSGSSPLATSNRHPLSLDTARETTSLRRQRNLDLSLGLEPPPGVSPPVVVCHMRCCSTPARSVDTKSKPQDTRVGRSLTPDSARRVLACTGGRLTRQGRSPLGLQGLLGLHCDPDAARPRRSDASDRCDDLNPVDGQNSTPRMTTDAGIDAKGATSVVGALVRQQPQSRSFRSHRDGRANPITPQ